MWKRKLREIEEVVNLNLLITVVGKFAYDAWAWQPLVTGGSFNDVVCLQDGEVVIL